jgi:hypothetical protein
MLALPAPRLKVIGSASADVQAIISGQAEIEDVGAFGLFAPRNATVITALFVAAMSVSGAIFSKSQGPQRISRLCCIGAPRLSFDELRKNTERAFGYNGKGSPPKSRAAGTLKSRLRWGTHCTLI